MENYVLKQYESTLYFNESYPVISNVLVNRGLFSKLTRRGLRKVYYELTGDTLVYLSKLYLNDEYYVDVFTTMNNCSVVFIQNHNVSEELFNLIFRPHNFTIAISDRNLFGNSFNFWRDLWVYQIKPIKVERLPYCRIKNLWDKTPHIGKYYAVNRTQRFNGVVWHNISNSYRYPIFNKTFIFNSCGSILPPEEGAFFITYDNMEKRLPEYRKVYTYTAYRTNNKLGIFVGD